MNLTQWSFFLCAAVAAGGLLLATLIALRVRFPTAFGTAHGLFGLAALIVLFIVNLHGGAATPPLTWWGLGALLGAFAGGLILFRTVFPGRAPVPLVALHGGLALTGLYLIYRAAFLV
jgi:hypothetical protein